MLLRFRVANYRSLRDEHELSFVASDVDDEIVRHTGVESGGKEIGVIPAVGIFGANASGKSNLLSALVAMRAAVRDSVADWARDEGVPRDPFALDPACRRENTLFEVDLLLGQTKVRYTYGFELSDERVEAEWLHAYPGGHKQVWFDREADRAGGEEFRFPNENLRGAKKLVELARPNALFLTVGASFNNKQLRPLHRWFTNNFWVVASDDAGVAQRSDYTRERLVDPKRGDDYRKRVESLLRVADLGIVGLDIDEALPNDQQVKLLHRTGRGKPLPLDFRTQESLGTHAWFAFLGPVLEMLERGSVLLADELDSSLHPVLAAEVVRLFQDPDANPNGAQLLFTTHDATLLGKGVVGRPLSRDQVWITTKRGTGETELYPLTDAGPRTTDNLELGYLRGRYGGVPRVTAGELAREVTELVSGGV
ncbi:ATP-binding protein [Amycolatopsis mongoliensis]|uniref:ATP-binding protein n=1 Tax=Amycolatopsis mongoliensis TaxID=715475 RepID=A0A9Y2NHA0_9PSEU|nr:ATP-binding protein [Amycolatopsis sp. 4-36]WIY05611.1 ATP-binding protein [Amycolatopsis sp. 4-36]